MGLCRSDSYSRDHPFSAGGGPQRGVERPILAAVGLRLSDGRRHGLPDYWIVRLVSQSTKQGEVLGYFSASAIGSRAKESGSGFGRIQAEERRESFPVRFAIIIIINHLFQSSAII